MERFIEIVDGLLLGDGTITKQGSLRVDQSYVRVGWLKAIQADLAAIGVSSVIDPVRRAARLRSDGRLLPAYNGSLLRVPAYAESKIQRRRWYPRGKKKVPMDVRISPRTVADWVSGDGTGTLDGGLIFCTAGFTKPEKKRLIARLRDAFQIRLIPTATGSIGLFRKDEVLRLRDQILAHVPECCRYKFRHVRPAQKRGALDQTQVRAIRSRYDQRERLAVLAKEYGLSRSAINNIGLRRSYRWIDDTGAL